MFKNRSSCTDSTVSPARSAASASWPKATPLRLMLAALAAAAVSSTAAAQPYGWTVDVAEPVLGPVGSMFPQETEIIIRATFDSTVDYAMGAGEFDFIASEAGIAGVNWHSNVLLAPLDFIPADRGFLTDTGATTVKPGQLHFPFAGIFADPANPAMAWRITYTATDFTPRDIDVETLTSQFLVYDDPADSTSRAIALASLVEGSGRITIVPAPAPLALLGLAGLCFAQRRR